MNEKYEKSFRNGYIEGSIAGLKIAEEALLSVCNPAPIILHDVEKIRQEAIEEFRKGLIESMGLMDGKNTLSQFTNDYILSKIESYNLPTK